MRLLSAVLLLALLMEPRARAQHGTIDASESLFTTLCAINLAGYDAELDSPTNHPLRKQIRDYLAARNLSTVSRLKAFYKEHHTGDPAATLSQYVSFALLSKGPPDFGFESLTYELPPDIQPLVELSPLLAEFHQEADIPSLFAKIQPAIDEIAARYQQPVTESLFELNGYLRNPTSGVAGRSFQIIISLMGAPNQIHTRSYSSNYYIVVTPSVEPQISDIRYTYLHYVLEPVVSRATDALERVRALGDYALGAPHLPAHYKEDFRLLATTSLIKAIEARLSSTSEEKRQEAVELAYRQGYVLTPYFAEQLPAYEKQEESMRLYFRDMIEELDLAKEELRAQSLEFEQTKRVRIVQPAAPPQPELSPAEETLREAEELYAKRDLEPARELFLRALRETGQKPLQARAYYGLARIATLNNDPELANSLFRKALELSPPPADRAWILVYLGRLSDIAGQPDEAAAFYREALGVEGASESARQMAETGASGAFRPRPQNNEP